MNAPRDMERPEALQQPPKPEEAETAIVASSQGQGTGSGPGETQSQTQPTPEPPEQPPSRLRRWLRKVLLGLTLAFLIFTCGWVAAFFTSVAPREDEVVRLRITLQKLERENRELTQQLEALQQRQQQLQEELDQTQQEAQALRAQVQELQAQVLLMQAQRHLYRAMVALQDKDTTTARLALQGTSRALEVLGQQAPAEFADILQDIQRNLEDLQPQLTSTPTTLRRLRQLADQLEELTAQWPAP